MTSKWSEITIDKEVAMPAILRFRSSKYPFKGMLIGDSFFVASKLSKIMRANLSTACSRFRPSKYKVMYYSADPVTDISGYRVWRIE